MNKLKNLSSNQKIAYVAMLAALGLVLNYIEIPYPLVPYLKFDLSEVVVLLACLISLPSALIVSFTKGLLILLLKGSDPIGVYSLISGSFTIAISFTYGMKLFKNLSESKRLISSLLFMSIIFTVLMLANNFFIVVPFYSGQSLSASIIGSDGIIGYTKYIVQTYLLFNILKATLISVVYCFIYSSIKGKLR